MVDSGVALYMRVSTPQQKIEMQVGMANMILQMFPASQIHRFVDEGISATKRNLRERPAIQKLIQCIQHREISTVISYDRSRIARNAYEYLEIAKIFNLYNVRVIFTGENEKAFSTSLFYEAVYASTAQFEGRNIGRRTLDARKHFPPKLIGFQKVEENGDVRYVRDEPRATYIQLFFEAMSNVSTLDQMEIIFREYRTRLERSDLRLLDILKTPFYFAAAMNENQTHPLDYVEPITTEELYNRVNENVRTIENAERQVKAESLSYRKIPVCGYCGHPMIIKKGDYFHRVRATYVCKNSEHKRNEIFILEYEELLMNLLREYLQSIDIEKMKIICVNYLCEQEERESMKIKSLKQEIQKVNVEIVTCIGIRKRIDTLLKKKEENQTSLRNHEAILERLRLIKKHFSHVAKLVKFHLTSHEMQNSVIWDIADDLIRLTSVTKEEVVIELRCKTFTREDAI